METFPIPQEETDLKGQTKLFDPEFEESEWLETHDLEVLKSMQTDWGPLKAGPSAKEHDPYDRVWIRDNSLAALALITAGEKELATEITEGLLSLLERDHDKIKNILSNGKPYATERNALLIHPVYTEKTKELNVEWGWRQNDSIGNLLQAVGALNLVENHKELISDLVKYLQEVEYWKRDHGIWEWTQQVQVNTLLSCAAGLKAVSDYVDVPEPLIKIGYRKAEELQGHSDIREFDLAHLNPFMLGEIADTKIIQNIEHILLRDNGVIRYYGDHYMSGGKGKEAQWVLGLLMLGQAWLACGEKEKAEGYLKKVDKLRTKDGDIPEAYIYKNGKYVPCEHTPLMWCHALALSLRRQLEK